MDEFLIAAVMSSHIHSGFKQHRPLFLGGFFVGFFFFQSCLWHEEIQESQARDLIHVITVTRTTAVTMPNL